LKKSMKEEWRSVKGYKYYEISNLGRLLHWEKKET
jgi:hypothetical protein